MIRILGLVVLMEFMEVRVMLVMVVCLGWGGLIWGIRGMICIRLEGGIRGRWALGGKRKNMHRMET